MLSPARRGNYLRVNTHEFTPMKTSRWQALSISQVSLILLLLLGVGLTFWMESASAGAELRSGRLNHEVDRIRFSVAG